MTGKLKKFGLWLGATMTLLPVSASAAWDPGSEGPTSMDELWSSVENILNWFLLIVLTIGTVMIIMGGVAYMMGDPDGGRKKLTYGVVGILIAVGAWSIIAIAKKLLGIDVVVI